MLMVVCTKLNVGWGVVAVAYLGTGDVLENHAHKDYGTFSSWAKARKVADAALKEYASGGEVPAACACEEMDS
jgi:hypothetical protein